MREALTEYVAWLYSKGHNATATAIKECLDGCSDEGIQKLWDDTSSIRETDGFPA